MFVGFFSVLLIAGGYLASASAAVAQKSGSESRLMPQTLNPIEPNLEQVGAFYSAVAPYPYPYYGTPYGSYDYSNDPYYFYYRGYYNSGIYDMGYSEGLKAGRSDKIRGNPYNPRQYERSGDGMYFAGFVSGYEDGYNIQSRPATP